MAVGMALCRDSSMNRLDTTITARFLKGRGGTTGQSWGSDNVSDAGTAAAAAGDRDISLAAQTPSRSSPASHGLDVQTEE